LSSGLSQKRELVLKKPAAAFFSGLPGFVVPAGRRFDSPLFLFAGFNCVMLT